MRATHNLLKILIVACLFSFNLEAMHNEMTDYTSENAKPATIKILIKEQVEGTLVEVKGPYKVLNPHSGKTLSSGLRSKRYFLYPKKDGLKWGEGYPGIYQIRILPTDPKTTILIDGIEYRGSVDCYHIDDLVSIVNEVDIESYIKSTLTSHLSSHINENVTDALSIVARTNAYYTALKNTDAYWHVPAQEAGYEGNGSALLNTNIDRAVDATRYLVMTHEQHPFPTTWTENCAGKTANYQTIFRKSISSPEGIKSPFAEEIRSENSWTLSVPKEALAKIAKTNRVTGIDLFVDQGSRKVYAMRIKDGVHFQDLDFLTLQAALGEKLLQSNDFSISLVDDQVIFKGYGKGPGVGLCIYSATCMADKGELVPHILGTFFPLTRLVYMRGLPDDLNDIKIESTKKEN